MSNPNTLTPSVAAESLTPSELVVTAGNARLLISDHKGDRAIVGETWRDNVYRCHPKPHDVIVDIGAYKGVFAVWAALHGALVHAYEPCQKSFETMLLNLRMNGVNDLVCPRKLAVWSQACHLPLYWWDEDAGGNSLTEGTRPNSEMVTCTTLDEIFTYIKWCDFLKVDCEGAEFEILGYAPDEVLARIGAISVEVHSPALDPGGREHPVKFTAYTEERYARVLERLGQHFQIEELRTRNGDPNYLYCMRS